MIVHRRDWILLTTSSHFRQFFYINIYYSVSWNSYHSIYKHDMSEFNFILHRLKVLGLYNFHWLMAYFFGFGGSHCEHLFAFCACLSNFWDLPFYRLCISSLVSWNWWLIWASFMHFFPSVFDTFFKSLFFVVILATFSHQCFSFTMTICKQMTNRRIIHLAFWLLGNGWFDGIFNEVLVNVNIKYKRIKIQSHPNI